MPAIEETQPEKVGAQKARQRAGRHVEDARRETLVQVLLHEPVAEGQDLLEARVDRFAAEVVQIAGELSDGSAYQEFFVEVAPAPFRPPPAPKAGAAVR